MATDASPRWDRKVQQRLARGEAAALGEVYDRHALLVHALAHRVLGDEEAAGALTQEVFTRLWEHPESYDPAHGGLRSWVAALAHRLAVARLRQREAAALVGGGEGTSEDLDRRVRRASVAARADYIATSMPAPLRAVLELAYFQRRDYRQAAADLGISEEEARRRLRLGLQLLATAHDSGARGNGGYGGGPGTYGGGYGGGPGSYGGGPGGYGRAS
ncbi:MULTISPECIES: sigma-70 family RNA polymerase sigma factor [Streptomyces]|uniref:sigma-70 family RNA polymerase sigma factor n=1 Tax=Streptomyces TaxID=1883 RepID=UPI000866645A|nr:sigma-70 family RNA polymerase sigma factor [Streptomyces sp. SCSIO ZS0520]AOU78994.1 RNA polymerase ECF-subfamily sigma factor [Streptomyces albus]